MKPLQLHFPENFPNVLGDHELPKTPSLVVSRHLIRKREIEMPQGGHVGISISQLNLTVISPVMATFGIVTGKWRPI